MSDALDQCTPRDPSAVPEQVNPSVQQQQSSLLISALPLSSPPQPIHILESTRFYAIYAELPSLLSLTCNRVAPPESSDMKGMKNRQDANMPESCVVTYHVISIQLQRGTLKDTTGAPQLHLQGSRHPAQQMWGNIGRRIKHTLSLHWQTSGGKQNL